MKYIYHTIRIITILLITNVYVYAATIKGTVLDAETNESLIGVTVVLAAQTTSGTTTALDGTFVLNISQLRTNASDRMQI